jgi:hypothetical protein
MIDFAIFLLITVSLLIIGAGVVWAVQDSKEHELRVSDLASREGWTYRNTDQQLSRTIPGPYRTFGGVQRTGPRATPMWRSGGTATTR